jgi:error-prone DNA polymerase
VLKAFASFGFCKAHAAAFALPTYQSAWLKTHYPAHFLAGVLTHDPGMYPKRLILDDARVHGIAVLGLDVNASGDTYRVERLDPDDNDRPHRRGATSGIPHADGSVDAWRRRPRWGIRLSSPMSRRHQRRRGRPDRRRASPMPPRRLLARAPR